MSQTYKAILKGDHLEWTETRPPIVEHGQPVEVTLLGDPKQNEDRRKRMAEALDKLAASDAFADIPDPVAWQREIRKDRPLPGRDN